jgi:hypothetical protein
MPRHDFCKPMQESPVAFMATGIRDKPCKRAGLAKSTRVQIVNNLMIKKRTFLKKTGKLMVLYSLALKIKTYIRTPFKLNKCLYIMM